MQLEALQGGLPNKSVMRRQVLNSGEVQTLTAARANKGRYVFIPPYMGIQYSKMGISHHSFNSSCMGIFVYLLFVDVYTHAHASTRMAPTFFSLHKEILLLEGKL